MAEIRTQIMDAVVELFNQKGMKFTMDDISKKLHISKKTIYKEFNDKDELFYATVDYGFTTIKQKEAEIIADESLDIVDKIAKVIVCLPDNYKNIDFRQVYQLRDKYPVVYSRIAKKIETDWDETERLLKQAMKEGRIREVPIPVLRLTIEGAIERFLGTNELSRTDISYDQALDDMINIIINGLRI